MGFVVCPVIFGRHVLALDIAGFTQTLAECGHVKCQPVRRRTVEKTNHGHRRLRAHSERPRRRAPKHGDEFAAPDHSITSSAWASNAGGTSRRNALAVCILMMNSNLLARSIGSSAAFSPLRIRAQ